MLLQTQIQRQKKIWIPGLQIKTDNVLQDNSMPFQLNQPIKHTIKNLFYVNHLGINI